MSSWGNFGASFRNFSTRLFGDDLAEELEPMASAPPSSYASSAVSRIRPRPPLSLTEPNMAPRRDSSDISGHHRAGPGPMTTGPPSAQQDGSSAPRLPNPAALSSDQLQQAMKQLMQHPDLWSKYKEELAVEEHPNNPETVRRKLLDFLDRFGDRLAPLPPPVPQSTSGGADSAARAAVASVFQGMKVGLEDESFHNPAPTPSLAFDSMSQEELQEQMKILMTLKPDRWAEYKEILATEESPSDPDTVRRTLIAFLGELQKRERQHTRPSQRSFKRSSLFRALTDSLEGESQHLINQISSNPRSSTSTSDDTQRKMRLLRNDPALYSKYQDKLLADEETPAAELLNTFFEDHKAELENLVVADDERKKQEAMDASLLNLETATLAEEQSDTSFHHRHYLPPGATTQSEHVRSLVIQPDRRQQMMAYKDTISSRSVRSVQNAMKALQGEVGESSMPSFQTRARNPQGGTTQSEDAPSLVLQPDRRQKMMAYKDTISSRSVRSVQNAMKALQGEVSETSIPSDTTTQSEHVRSLVMRPDRRQQMMAYTDTISSRSVRSVQNAMKALQGEVEESPMLSFQTRASNPEPGSAPPPPERDPSQEMKSTFSSLVNWGKNFRLGNEEDGGGPSSKMDQSIRQGWRTVSQFVANEMVNINSELDPVHLSRRGQTTDDLLQPVTLPPAGSDGPLHSSMPLHFSPMRAKALVGPYKDPWDQFQNSNNNDSINLTFDNDNTENSEDELLTRASAIAFERRSNANVSAGGVALGVLESIRDDENEDDDEEGTEDGEDVLQQAARRDPMMEVTMHADEAEPPTPQPIKVGTPGLANVGESQQEGGSQQEAVPNDDEMTKETEAKVEGLESVAVATASNGEVGADGADANDDDSLI